MIPPELANAVCEKNNVKAARARNRFIRVTPKNENALLITH
jgi:hypothetical protein